MLSVNLVLKRVGADRLTLSLPISFRISFTVIVLLLIGSMISIREIAAIPLIVAIAAFMAGLYQERWIFDCDARSGGGQVTHEFGVYPILKRQKIELSAVKALILSNYREVPEDRNALRRRPIEPRTLTSFRLRLADGKERTVEIRTNRRGRELKNNAEAIAEFCGKPLEIEA